MGATDEVVHGGTVAEMGVLDEVGVFEGREDAVHSRCVDVGVRRLHGSQHVVGREVILGPAEHFDHRPAGRRGAAPEAFEPGEQFVDFAPARIAFHTMRG